MIERYRAELAPPTLSSSRRPGAGGALPFDLSIDPQVCGRLARRAVQSHDLRLGWTGRTPTAAASEFSCKRGRASTD